MYSSGGAQPVDQEAHTAVLDSFLAITASADRQAATHILEARGSILLGVADIPLRIERSLPHLSRWPRRQRPVLRGQTPPRGRGLVQPARARREPGDSASTFA